MKFVKWNPANWLEQMIYGANIVTVLALFASGYSYVIDPTVISITATWGMAFPLFAVLNMCFLVFWLFFRRSKAILPFLAFLGVYSPMSKYIGLNTQAPIPENVIKVMSYNVFNFHGMEGQELARDTNLLADYLVESDCDIVCMQESRVTWLAEKVREKLKKCYPYQHIMDHPRDGTTLGIFSKHRIVRAESIPYASASNMTMAYVVAMPEGEVLVVNNHLEGNHFSEEEKRNYKSLIKGEMPSDEMRLETKGLIRKLTSNSLIRTPQAKAVARYIKSHQDMPVIVCGDFNDVPLSYPHYVIGKGLHDCFEESGQGFGWSYCHGGMFVRIDNVLCSEHFLPVRCEVQSQVSYSDHYPIVSWIQWKDAHNEGKEKAD